MVTKVSLFSYKFTRATWVGERVSRRKTSKMFPWGPFFLVFLTYVYRNALIPRNQPYPKNFFGFPPEILVFVTDN